MHGLWWTLGVLAVLLIWLCLTRVGARAVFAGGEVRVDVQVGLIRFRVFPGKEMQASEKKKKKPKKEKKPKEEEAAGEGKKKGPKITLTDVREAVSMLWPPLKRALGRVGRGIRIHPLQLSLTLGGEEDPASTAQLYGELQAAVWNGMPALEKLMDIPDPGIHIGLDFCAAKHEAEGTAGVTIRIGTLLAVAFGVGIPALRWFLRFRKRRKQAQRPQQAAA